MSDDVIIGKAGRCGRIILNRPQALHAVTLEICERVTAAVRAWEKDGTALAFIEHSGGRGFSAGGDIRWLHDKIQNDPEEAKRFFFVEYQMNEFMFSSPLPLVSFMDGVVMGGGAGLALPCRYRLATENTKFAMPEAGIGLFPDVGGGWYLPRLPDGLGLHLALTGGRLNGEECVAAGVATHFIESARLPEVKAAIIAEPDSLEGVLSQSSSPARKGGAGRSQSLPLPQAEEDVIAKKSPLSIRVLKRQLEEGARAKSFADVMRMEYRIASRIIFEPDFAEGIRAFIIEKDAKPRWTSQAETGEFFAVLPAGQEWTPLERT